MEIPNEFVTLGGTAVVGLQAWTLAEVVKLKTKVAVIAATCNACETSNGTLMKLNKTLLGLFVASAIAVGFTGCGSLYTKSPAPPTVVAQPVYGLTTNAQGIVAIGQVGTTNVLAQSETWQLNTNLANALQTAQAVNAVVPSPVQPIVGGVLGLLATLAGAYGAYKSKQLTLSNAALTAVVAGVEIAGNPAIKQAIQNLAVANGSQPHLDAKVQAVSENVAPPPKS